SITSTSAASSTTHRIAVSREGSSQTGQGSSSVSMLQTLHRRTSSRAETTAWASVAASSGDERRRWYAMRAAPLAPIPGSRSKAAARRSKLFGRRDTTEPSVRKHEIRNSKSETNSKAPNSKTEGLHREDSIFEFFPRFRG